MNKIVFTLLLLTSFIAEAVELDIRDYEAADECNEELAQVRVTVTNVGEGGILTVELYDDPDNFLNKKGRERRIRVAAVQGQQRVCFNIDREGTFAIAAYHDIDGNRKLKKRWNMMPKEPFGLSNNPKMKLGFPKFSNSAFEVDESGADLTIILQTP